MVPSRPSVPPRPSAQPVQPLRPHPVLVRPVPPPPIVHRSPQFARVIPLPPRPVMATVQPKAARLQPPPLPPARPAPAAMRPAPMPPVQPKSAPVTPRHPRLPETRAPQAVQPFLAELAGTALAIGLTSLYQNYNREPEVFSNRQSAHWEDEYETMVRDGLTRHKAGTNEFNQQITGKRPFIWILDRRNDLYVMDGLTGDPKHSMAAMGRSIYSGGVGQWLDLGDGNGQVLTISNVTGHYHASYESQERAAAAFRRAGHPVKIREDRKGSAPRGYLWQTGRWLGLV